MEITFQTKEESNKKQQEDFLKLNPSERFYRFLELMMASKKLYKTKNKKIKSFKIIIETPINGK